MDQGKHACRRWYCGYMKDSPPAKAGGLILVVGIVLLLTGGADDKTSAENMGGESYAVVLDE